MIEGLRKVRMIIYNQNLRSIYLVSQGRPNTLYLVGKFVKNQCLRHYEALNLSEGFKANIFFKRDRDVLSRPLYSYCFRIYSFLIFLRIRIFQSKGYGRRLLLRRHHFLWSISLYNLAEQPLEIDTLVFHNDSMNSLNHHYELLIQSHL